jgi:uncharacterized phage-associated protein
MIEFVYDEERARHSTLWLLKQHGPLDHIKLLKLILLADLEHLKRYGRPIAGGPYFAMEHGPVSSELFDDLKLLSASPSASKLSGTEAVNDFTLRALVEPNEDYLSETDLEVLRYVNEVYGGWDRYRLSTETHKLSAWIKNYKGPTSDGRDAAYPIPYDDFMADVLDKTMAAIVADAQDGERILG